MLQDLPIVVPITIPDSISPDSFATYLASHPMESGMIEELMEMEEPVDVSLNLSETILNHLLPMVPPVTMCLITLMLVLVLLCAWKAPRWIKPVGSIALALGIIRFAWGFICVFYDVTMAGAVSPNSYAGGIPRMLFIIIYGLLVFILSRIVYLIQKSRN